MSIVSGTVGAVMGADATESAAEKGAAAQRDATAAQERIYQQMRNDFEPYRQIGLSGLPYIESAVLGQPVTTVNPGYSVITSGELDAINRQSLATNNPQALGATGQQGLQPVLNPMFSNTGVMSYTYQQPPPQYINGQGGAVNHQVPYDPAKTWYRGPNGEITSTPGTKQISWTPGESPAAKYQLEKGTTALQRALAARGLGGSGYATTKLADLNKSVSADDWNNQYNRLLDLVKVGTGASAATGGAANSLSSAYGQGAANIGNLAAQSGAARASLYSGLGGASANTVGTGMRLYDYGKGAGWWGGSGAGSGAATTYGSAGNTFGSDEIASWAAA